MSRAEPKWWMSQKKQIPSGSAWLPAGLYAAGDFCTDHRRQNKKGDVLAVAQVAGVMAAKKTWEIIPMCHPLLLTGVDIHFELYPEKAEIEAIASVRTTGKTGIEMEALHAVSAALLTIYDMCKAVDRGMVIKDILLLEKDGGKSGHYIRG